MLVYFASCMIHRAFLQCSLDALYRGQQRIIVVCAGVFLLPVAGKGVSHCCFSKNSVLFVYFSPCRSNMAFLQCSLDALYRSTRAFLQRSFDIP